MSDVKRYDLEDCYHYGAAIEEYDDGKYVTYQAYTEQAATIERLRGALKRIATPSAFWVATSDVNPECLARMVYAECVLDGGTAEEAEALATVKAQERGGEKMDILRKRAALGETK